MEARNNDGTEDTGPWARASLVLHSQSLSEAEISALLGTSPSSSKAIGSRVGPKSAARHEHTVWIHESGVPESSPLEDHLTELTTFVSERSSALSSLPETSSLRVSISYSTPYGIAALTLLAQHIKVLGELGIDIWLDVFE